MFSLKNGTKIGVISGKGAGKKRNKKELFLKNEKKEDFKNPDYISDSDSESEDEEEEFFNEVNIDYGLMQQYPNTDLDRECIYIAGPSGSGKSTYAANYLKQYKKAYPDNPIILFSRKPEDPVLDKLKPMRIMIDEDLLDDPITLDELRDSAVVFDDIDTIADKQLLAYIQHLRDDILEVARSYHTTCICTSHQITNYKATRVLLNEATSIVFFPKSGSSHGIKYCLKQYCGISDKKDLKKILNLPSRWVCLNKTYPMHVLYSFGAYKV